MTTKKHRKQATSMQLMAINLHSQGMSKTQAMRKAGYRESTISNPRNVFSSNAIVTAVDKFKLQLNDKNLTTEYMATKLSEWFEATDAQGNPDYTTQLQAYKLVKEIVIDSEVKQDKPIRTVTLSEYLQPT
jgi:hypothetical protein